VNTESGTAKTGSRFRLRTGPFATWGASFLGSREVTEETFLLALRSADSFPSDLPVRTSLYRLAISRSLIRLRSISRLRA
jgi:DNA-directed RNA polymerase specialized sigma24 family protein